MCLPPGALDVHNEKIKKIACSILEPDGAQTGAAEAAEQEADPPKKFWKLQYMRTWSHKNKSVMMAPRDVPKPEWGNSWWAP